MYDCSNLQFNLEDGTVEEIPGNNAFIFWVKTAELVLIKWLFVMIFRIG